MKILIEFLKYTYNNSEHFKFYNIQNQKDFLVLNALLQQYQKQDSMYIILCPDNLVFQFNKKICEYLSFKYNHYLNIYFIKFLGQKPFKNIAWLDENVHTFNFANDKSLIYNTLIPTDFNPPKYETFNHTKFLNLFFKEFANKNLNYIEYGVRDCKNLNEVANNFKECYGIDINNFETSHPNVKTYIMTTDQFSKSILPDLYYHFAFIDANHSFNSAYTDFQYLFRFLQSGGFIFLHDTYPCNIDFLKEQACYDCYKTPLKIKKEYKNKCEILTLPFNPGLTIIKKF